MLTNVKMPTIVGILTVLSRINFVLSWVEYTMCEQSYITSGPGLRLCSSQTTTSCFFMTRTNAAKLSVSYSTVFSGLLSFFHFILLFWNHILICRSVRQSVWDISIRRRRVKYLLKWNSFSSSNVWWREYVCLPLFLLDPAINRYMVLKLKIEPVHVISNNVAFWQV